MGKFSPLFHLSRRGFLRMLPGFLAPMAGAPWLLLSKTGISKSAPISGFPRLGGRTVLKACVHSRLSDRPFLVQKLRDFAERVSIATGRGIQIEVTHEQSTLGFRESVQSGPWDILLYSPAFTWSRHPATLFFGSGSFGLEGEQKARWLTSTEGSSLWRETYAKDGVVPVFFGTGPEQHGLFARVPIESIVSFKGLRASARGSRIDWVAELGASPVASEDRSYMIDDMAAEKIDFSEALSHVVNHRIFYAHFDERGRRAASLYYTGAHWRSSATYELLFCQNTWKSLGSEARGAIQTSASQVGDDIRTQFQILSSKSLTLLGGHPLMLSVQPLPEDVRRYFEKKSKAIMVDLASIDALAKRVKDSYISYLA